MTEIVYKKKAKHTLKWQVSLFKATPPPPLDRFKYNSESVFFLQFCTHFVWKVVLIQPWTHLTPRKRFSTRMSRKSHLWCLLFRSETTKAFSIDLHYNVCVRTDFPISRWPISYLSFESSIQARSENDLKSMAHPITFRATDGQTRWPPFPHKISRQLPKNTNCLNSTD